MGWLKHQTSTYIIIIWDTDAGAPTLKGGDAKASGLVILKSDILEIKNLTYNAKLTHNADLTHNDDTVSSLKYSDAALNAEYAFQSKKRKTHKTQTSKKIGEL